MTTDTEQIRTLIERWAEGVHRGDMAGVLADHAEDIVMFDVPPPQDGVRGIDAYRETWPGFFAWQASGASFDIVSLDVVAGDDVAFAYALLRCGTADQDPDVRLRITFGLRKEDGRWVVAHEHHSVPDRSDPADADAIRAVHERWSAATAARDLDGIMTCIAPDVVSYEHEHHRRFGRPPRARRSPPPEEPAKLRGSCGERCSSFPAPSCSASDRRRTRSRSLRLLLS